MSLNLLRPVDSASISQSFRWMLQGNDHWQSYTFSPGHYAKSCHLEGSLLLLSLLSEPLSHHQTRKHVFSEEIWVVFLLRQLEKGERDL